MLLGSQLKFDAALREHAPTALHYLYGRMMFDLPAGIGLNDVAFETECDPAGQAHSQHCRVCYVVVRWRYAASESSDAKSILFTISLAMLPAYAEAIIRVHNLICSEPA